MSIRAFIRLNQLERRCSMGHINGHFLLNLLFIFVIRVPKSRSDTLYCSLHFVVDYPLWKLTFTTRAGQDYFRTNTILSSYIYRNLEGLNELYGHYRFPYASKTRNVSIQFFIHGITVVTEHICNQRSLNNNQRTNPLKPFCSDKINSDALLDLIAQFADYDKKTSQNHPACLYYGITSRRLHLQNNEGIALGWSWRGHLCEDLREMPNWSSQKISFNPRYSGNVGVVTASFDASDYSLSKGEMTFFHEIGHSMNANHDNLPEFNSRPECDPSENQGGSYLMYATATEGLMPNNRFYSHCSLDTIAQYTERLGRMKPTCLKSSKTIKSRCDGVYSADEACDESGTSSTCCTSDCKLKAGAVCSPSTGSCCQSTCQFHPSTHTCLADSDCKKTIYCSGQSSTCPENDSTYFKADKTLCRGGTLLCMNGSCALSICELHSLRPCQLKEDEDDLCLIACRTANGKCQPFHSIGSNSSESPRYLPYGSLCKSNQGFCDQNHKCSPLLLDENSNLIGAGLSSLLLTNHEILFQRYWWILLIIIISQFVLIPIVIFYFRSSCIPSNNPFLE